MSRSPPLRFLVLLLAGWCGMRTAVLAPGWWTPPASAGRRAPAERRPALAPRPAAPASSERDAAPGRVAAAAALPRRRPTPKPAAVPAPVARRTTAVAELAWDLAPASPSGRRGPTGALPGEAVPARAAAASRWSFAAWSYLREGNSAPLAAGGLLGGSQAGLRLGYRLNRDEARPLALTARLSTPLRRPAAEASLGLDWQPLRRLPVHLLGERRQRLGGEGRSAFALTVHGGLSDAPLGRLRIDAYAQAGIVGLRSADRFGDGALRLSLPLGGRVRAGLGAWAAAQPGAAR
ncbi:MAG TPA: hypothetical protein VF547_01160, partial [Allosphingosinicella sp.]